MLDVVYIGLTVVFFVAVAALAKGVERLGRSDGSVAGPGADPDIEPATDLAGSTGPVGSGVGGEVRR